MCSLTGNRQTMPSPEYATFHVLNSCTIGSRVLPDFDKSNQADPVSATSTPAYTCQRIPRHTLPCHHQLSIATKTAACHCVSSLLLLHLGTKISADSKRVWTIYLLDINLNY